MAELGMDLIEVIVDYDEMEPGDLAVVNRFLKELGSTQQLEDE